MKVSIIMAALQQGDWVRHTVKQIKGAIGDLDHEIIVVDDHSSDGCCTGLPKDVLILHPKRRAGVSGARILAASQATGDMFIFSDPHCDYPTNALKDLAEYAATRHAIVQPPTVLKPGSKRVRYGGKLAICDRGLRVARHYERPGFRYPALIGTIYAVRRDVYDFLGGWPKLPGVWGCSEQALTLMSWYAGVPIICDQRHVCVHHDYHPTDETGKQHFNYSVKQSDHAGNCHFIHAAFFPMTYADYWKPMIDNKFRNPKYSKCVQSKEMQEIRDHIRKISVRSEVQLFNEVLDMRVPMPAMEKAKTSNGEYVKQQARKSKPKEYPEVRRRVRRCVDWMQRAIPGCYKGRKVVDLGTRDGYATEYITSPAKTENGKWLGKGARECLGVELVPETAEYARKQGRNVVQGDMMSLDLQEGSFDIVQSIHALEHVPDPHKAFSEMVRVCRPGGWCLAVVPMEDTPDKRHAHNVAWPAMDEFKKTINDTPGVDKRSIKHKTMNLARGKTEFAVAFRKAR